MAEDLGNLEIQRQINEMLSERSSIYAKQTEMLKGQAQLALNIAELLGKDTSGYRTSIEEATASLDEAASAAERVASSSTSMEAAAASAGEEIENTAQATNTLGDVVKKTFTKVKDTLVAVAGLTATVFKGITGIASSVLTIPLGIFTKFQEYAAKLAADSMTLTKAFEEIRGKFGDIASNEGKNVVEGFKDLRSQSDNLAGSGRSLSSIYGYGPEGLAAALKDVGETASALGPTLSVLGKQFEENAASISIMKKGLDLSNEAILSLGNQALARGENLNDTFKEVANLSTQMSKKFGISSKEIGRAMGYMTSNMGKFGSMTKAQMATAAVYTRKLGLEMKDLEGVMGAFDDFETAATNASKLSQAFGMNIDAMEMMKEQDPAKRLDSLRKAFAATGKSIETMSRQEKAMLAQSAGLSENLVETALSAKNMGLSYDEVSAAAEGAADKQLSQEEIMQNMAKNIEKVFAPFEYVAGLLQNFMNGFVTGIMRSKPAMALLQSMMRVIMDLYHMGLDVGQMFVKSFPGVSKMFYGLADIFKNFRTSIKEIKHAFNDFFAGLQKDPVEATQNFMKKIQEIFFSQFDMKKGGGKFLDGLKQFGIAMAKVLFGMGKWLLGAIIDGIKNLVAYLSNPQNLTAAANSGLGKMFSEMMDYLAVAIPDLWNTFVDLLYAVAPIVWDWLKDTFASLWSTNFGKALIIGVGLLVGGSLIKELMSKIFGAFGGAAEEAAGEQGGFFAGIFRSFFDAISNIGLYDMAKIGLIAVGVAEFLTRYLEPLVDAFASASKKMTEVNWNDLGKVFAVVGGTILAVAGMVKVVQSVGSSLTGDAIATIMGAIAGFITLYLLEGGWIHKGEEQKGLLDTFASFIEKMKDVSEYDVLKGVGVLAAMIGTFWLLAETANKIGPVMGALLIFFQGPIIGFMSSLSSFITTSLVKFAASVAIAGALANTLSLDSIAKIAAIIGLIGLTAGVLAGSAVVGTIGMAASPIKTIKSFLTGTTEPLSSAIDGIAEFFSNTEGPLIRIINSINALSAGLGDPESVKTSIGIVSSVIGAISPFIDVMKMAGDISSKGDPAKASENFTSIVASMESFIDNSLGKLTATVQSILSLVSGISVGKGQTAKIKIFGDIIEAFGSFMGAVTAPLNSLSSISFDASKAGSASSVFDSFITFMFGSAKGTTVDMNSFMYKITNAIPMLIGSINKAFDGMDAKQVSSLGNKASALTKVMTAFKELSGIFGEIGSGATGVGPMLPVSIDSFLFDLETNMGSLATYLPKLVDVSNQIEDYKFGAVASLVSQITEDIKAVNDSLIELGNIEMDATIEKVGAALGIKDTVIKLDRKPIQMNVQLNLTMKAEDIAKEIFDVAYKMTYPGEGTSTATPGMKEAYFGATPPK